MLDQIREALEKVLPDVYYGAAGNVSNVTLWKYIVFSRDHWKRSTNNNSYTEYYTVAIVCENAVPAELLHEVIRAMEALPGVRLANADIDFEYTTKPSTNKVVEIAMPMFSCPFLKVG